MRNFEVDYVNLVSTVITAGDFRSTRAGPTLSVFGTTIQIDCLEEGFFPILTQRKIQLQGILGELAAFLRGATDLKTFKDFGCPYWNANAEAWAPNVGKSLGSIQVGKIYGYHWRNWTDSSVVEKLQPIPQLRAGIPKTVLGIANGSGRKTGDPLSNIWGNMLRRCYDPTYGNYQWYGARGVYVADAWLEFAKFAEDAKTLPNWDPATGRTGLQLDKDSLGSGFVYSKATCQWLTPAQNKTAKPKVEYTVEKDGQRFVFTNTKDFCIAHQLIPGNMSRMLHRQSQSHKGFRLLGTKFLSPLQGKLDQLQVLVDKLKSDPDSRRHLLTTYNPSELTDACLPPCHLLAQYNVRKNKLDCIVYMRSVDLCVGLPSDVILYATLLLILCNETGYTPGKLTFMLADTHVYLNHVDQFQIHAAKPMHTLPRFTLRGEAGINTFVPEDLRLSNYVNEGVHSYVFNK